MLSLELARSPLYPSLSRAAEGWMERTAAILIAEKSLKWTMIDARVEEQYVNVRQMIQSTWTWPESIHVMFVPSYDFVWAWEEFSVILVL